MGPCSIARRVECVGLLMSYTTLHEGFSTNASQRVGQFDALQLGAACKGVPYDFLNASAGDVHCSWSDPAEVSWEINHFQPCP